MRKIEKDFYQIPKNLKDCAKNNESHLLESKEVNADCYKKAKDDLEKLYHKKCAYCESKYQTTSSTWIEHYRPKKARENKEKPEYNHSGYHWLAYEWSNLLPTCENCNRPKSNKFPLLDESQRVKEPTLLSDGKMDKSKNLLNETPLKNELAMIINPEIDEPIDFFFLK